MLILMLQISSKLKIYIWGKISILILYLISNTKTYFSYLKKITKSAIISPILNFSSAEAFFSSTFP